MNKKWKAAICTFIKWFFLICMASFALNPLLQVVFNSFRSDQEVKGMPIGLTQKATLANYFDTWTIGEYGGAYLNTLLVAGVVITVVLTVVGLGAYALSKLDFRLKGFMTAYFFVAISLPSFLYIVPDYSLLNRLGLVNTRVGLMIVYTAMQIPFNMLLLKTFLMGIPREFEEAAKIDG